MELRVRTSKISERERFYAWVEWFLVSFHEANPRFESGNCGYAFSDLLKSSEFRTLELQN